MIEKRLVADRRRGREVATLCRRAAEEWADGGDSTAARYHAAALALIGNGEFVDSPGMCHESIGKAPKWRSD